MSALGAGTQAPQFELPAMDGSKFSLKDALSRGPVLAVFLKISCPICQYALPYFERVYKAHGRKNVSIVGISQNERNDT
ncbi:MAG TPA: redoxin domain-containing protein, partial [Terriglobales bacterium]|nr:redoxin domain-containing protein [Terriglobales bacterium]